MATIQFAHNQNNVRLGDVFSTSKQTYATQFFRCVDFLAIYLPFYLAYIPNLIHTVHNLFFSSFENISDFQDFESEYIDLSVFE